MRNLELKARCADLAHAEEIARRLGAAPGGTLQQVDTYFQTPSGRLKLRQLNRGSGELIYYERSEDSAVRWSNYFTAPVADCAALRDVLARAYGLRLEVGKSRMLYLYRGARIHLDRVERLGAFLEFEVPVESDTEAESDRARLIMRELMSGFGLQPGDAIRASYADLLQESTLSAIS
jgi:adenylate cyclase, class 2